jgi:hypothetical protein
MLNKEISEKVLSTIRPLHVFSGDDHDFCHIQHLRGETNRIHSWEDTVPTFSALGGIWRPGFAVVELKNTKEGEKNFSYEYNVKICFLPSQWGIFILYGCCATGIVLFLLVLQSLQFWKGRNRTGSIWEPSNDENDKKLRKWDCHLFLTSLRFITIVGSFVYLVLLILI